MRFPLLRGREEVLCDRGVRVQTFADVRCQGRAVASSGLSVHPFGYLKVLGRRPLTEHPGGSLPLKVCPDLFLLVGAMSCWNS